MKNRLKELRKALGLTQQQFADKMGIGRNPIAACEAGRTEPDNAAIALICRTYGVNETWLRTGEGEMFKTQSREEEISLYVSKILGDDDRTPPGVNESFTVDFRRQIVSILAQLSSREWKLLEDMAYKLAKGLPEAKDPTDD